MLDFILLDRFPGRTLEELDQMDITRYFRAQQAKTQTLPIEYKRRAWLGGVLKTEDMTPQEWQAIAEHDAMVSE